MKLGRKKEKRTRRSDGGAGNVPLTYYRSNLSKGEKTLEKKQLPRKKRSKFIVRLFDMVMVVVIITAVGFNIVLAPSSQVNLSENSYNPTSEYQKAVDIQLRKWKNRNKITINEAEITASLKDQFPEIDEAKIILPVFGQQPKVEIEVSPAVLFLARKSETYVVNARGVVIADRYQLPQVKNLPLVYDESQFEFQPGAHALNSSSVEFIGLLLEQLKRSKIEVESLTLPPLAQQLHLQARNEPYFVKFFLGDRAQVQVGQYLAARKTFSSQQNKQPKQYLDVRVEGKIFYK